MRDLTSAPASASLRELLDAGAIPGLRVVTPDAELGVDVRAVAIADVDDVERVPPAAVVLVPGAPADRSRLEALLSDSARAGAAAVVLRETTWTAAMSAGGTPPATPPVVGVPDRLAWADLYELLTATLLSAGRIGPHRPTDRPMADLFALADAVAAALGGAVTIEDHQARVLAYSNLPGQEIDATREDTILQRRVPLTDAFRARYVTISQATEPVAIHDDGQLPRTAVAIRAGDEILGFLFVIGDETTLADDAAQQIAHAARMAAVHLVRARSAGDIARDVQDDALRRLLDGNREERLLASTVLRSSRSAGVLAVRRVHGADDDPAAGWLGGLVALTARGQHADAQCVSIDDVAYLVVGSGSDQPPDLTALAWTIVERSAERGRDMIVGVATTQDVAALGDARREADRVLAVLAERGEAPAVASRDDVRSAIVLAELRTLIGERLSLLDGPVRAMLDPDRRAPAWSLETLHAYFACLGNQPATAAALGIHPNSLRYRIERLVSQFDLRLDDPDERLVVALQLRLGAARPTRR